jgi:hypothetical protein
MATCRHNSVNPSNCGAGVGARQTHRGDSLRPNFHVTVALESTKPTEIQVDLEQHIMDRDIMVYIRGRRDSNPRRV